MFNVCQTRATNHDDHQISANLRKLEETLALLAKERMDNLVICTKGSTVKISIEIVLSHLYRVYGVEN